MNRSIFEMAKYKNFGKMLIKPIILVMIESLSIVVLFPYFYNIILNEKINSGNIKEILIFGALFIILALIRCLFAYLGDCEKNKCKIEMESELRKEIYIKLQKEKIKYYDQNRNSDILELLVNDSEEAADLFPGSFIKLYILALFRALALIAIMLILDYRLGLITISIYFIGYLIVIGANKISIRILNDKRNSVINLVNYTNETIKGFETVKILGIEEWRNKQLDRLISKFLYCIADLDKITRRYTFIYQVITFGITISNVYLGSMDIVTGICTYASLVLIIQYSENANNYLNWIVEGMPMYNSNKLAFNKILDYLENSNIEDYNSGKDIEEIKNIEFKNIEFSYKDTPIIKKFTTSICQGEKVAFVGKTGSGKTTIANLLCRFYSVDKGNILINGENIEDFNIKTLRKKIGYVMQDNFIFEGTILENIGYANKDISKEKIIEICKRLKINDKIMSLPNGYETVLKNDGSILSNGEKQLINFARVMILDPDVIILDEVTSALSCEMEETIQDAIKVLTKGKICIIIAHRLSTIKECDRIILLDKGKILEEGKHEELIAQKGEYYKMITEF